MKKRVILSGAILLLFLASCHKTTEIIKQDEILKDENNIKNSEQANKNRETIEKFYTAFKNRNSEDMVKLYHNDVEFQDPAFGILKGDRAKSMWKMLVERAKEIEINFNNINVDENSGTANWDAIYTFSQTGNRVHNKIKAKFIFKDGLIYKHQDEFNLWEWSKQAFGFTGWLLGSTPIFKDKLNKEANKGLDEYISKNKL